MKINSKIAIVILLLITFITFGNSLLNGFAGDDHLWLLTNDFYRSWENLPLLFQSEYIFHVDEMDINQTQKHSGEVSYRPVKSLTHFIDYGLWQMNPFGHHLTNFLLHFLNSFFLYCFLSLILKNRVTALICSVLFCVHPIQTETVCAINYRQAMLANLFMLISFICYIKLSDIQRGKRIIVNIVSQFAFFLALFSKEFVVVYPILLLIYDLYIRGDNLRTCMRNFQARYLNYILILIFYLFIYLFVFPHSVSSRFNFLGGNIVAHLFVTMYIFIQYLISFIFPFTVKILPPYYSPGINDFAGHEITYVFLIILFVIFFLVRSFRRKNLTTFLLLWVFITYIPVSNIIPIANPMAYRFVYTPLIGLIVLTILIIKKIFLNEKCAYIQKIIIGGFIFLCMMISIQLNNAWKNDHTLAYQIYKSFPNDPNSNLFAGMVLYDMGRCPEAIKVFDRSLQLGVEDPRVYYFMTMCYFNDFEKAKPYYIESIRMYPKSSFSYKGLGRIYLMQGEPTKAIGYLRKNIALVPSYAGYGYLIQAYLLLDQKHLAEEIFTEAQSVISDQNKLQSLSKFLSDTNLSILPIDIGI